jgi:hypothetical protein
MLDKDSLIGHKMLTTLMTDEPTNGLFPARLVTHFIRHHRTHLHPQCLYIALL